MNAHRSLSERTAIGVSWTAASAAVTLAGTVISQTILALFLTDDDFGAYAIAVGFSAYLTALKSGGVRVVLMRRPPKAVLALGGSALVLASVSSVSVAGILFGLSGPVARIYDEAVIEPILQLIALALVVDIYTSVAMSSLQSELRFSAVARIDTGSSIIQYTSTILLAILDLGLLVLRCPSYLQRSSDR